MLEIFLSKSKSFLVFEIVFLGAVFFSSFFESYLVGKSFYLLLILSFVLLLLIFFWEKLSYRIILFIVLFLFLGIWRFSLAIYVEKNNEIASLNNQNSTLEIKGIIQSNPEKSQKNQSFVLRVEKIGDREYSGNLLVYADLYPVLFYGDRLELQCKIKSSEPIEYFAYDKYLAMKNIYSLCYYPQIKIFSRENGNIVFSNIYRFKNSFKDSINKNLTEPYSSIVMAMVLGDKKSLNDDTRLQFSKAGISHIIAISGMHIGVFILVFAFLFFYLGFSRNLIFYLTFFFLFFYNILIAFPASSLRASFMGILLLYAAKIGRLNKVLNSIVLAGTILILINPLYIRYDLGFIFSFLALLGIIYFYPVINAYFKERENRFLKYLKDIVIVSISAQIFLLPLIVLKFKVLSFISPLVNLLVVWTLPFILISVLLAFFFSVLFSSFGFYFYLPVKILISYILFIVQYSLRIPFSNFHISNFPVFYIYIYYFIILFFVVYREYRKKMS